jgi:two-component system nitrogen regulation sensor histidine kinase NtrY
MAQQESDFHCWIFLKISRNLLFVKRINQVPLKADLAFEGSFWYSAENMRTNTPETKGGWKGVIALVSFLLLTALAIVLQLQYRGFEGPLSDNILIFILINANFLLLTAVIFMMARSLWKVWMERRQGVLGARFRTKLVFAFVSLSFIPPVLLFLIGSGMFTRSIERLFSLRIENSLKDAVSVSQEYYDRLEKEAFDFGKQISTQMTDARIMTQFENQVLKEYLTRKAEEYGLGSVELFSSPRERSVTVVTNQYPPKTFTRTPVDLVAKAFKGDEAADVTGSAKRGEIMRVVVPLYELSSTEAERQVVAALAVSFYIPQSLAAKAVVIREGYAQYRSAFSGKEPIKLSYRLGFLSVTLALLLAAIWVALRVAAGITVPIRKLAEGTAAVAAGRFDYRINETSDDEVGVLIDSFNKMTLDLQQSRERVEQEVNYKKTILSNIETGVVSIDRTGRITTVNQSASEILGIQEQGVLGRRYDEAFEFLELEPIRGLFRRLEQGQGREEKELQLNVRGRMLTLRMRISTLRDGNGAVIGSVITFDDLTELLRAKKAETWQDVARRIAHEFKNPLTPIKLSAERLRKKHAEGSPDFNAIFDECSLTIVQEADGLRKLVDEFANFARMPSSNPILQPLAPVLESVVQLYSGAHKDIVFAKDIQPDMPEVFIDHEQIKRVFINLFENAIEAMGGSGRILVAMKMTPAGMAQIDIADEGPGIAAEDVPKLFEPEFSRKKTKSGLGLAIVLRIIKDHHGTISVTQNDPHGARFIIELPASVKHGDAPDSTFSVWSA